MATHLPAYQQGRKSAWLAIVVVTILFLAAGSLFSQTEAAVSAAEGGAAPGGSAQEPDTPSKKRAEPRKAEPVEFEGVRYSALRGGRGRGLNQNGGYIVAENASDGQELWIAKIYDCQGDGDMESDKADVYIERIELDRSRRRLLITDERNRRYFLDLRDHSVTTLGR